MMAVNHLGNYAKALWPTLFRVGGYWLQPFSIGHLLLLIRLRNPIGLGNPITNISDLVTAVAVCSMPSARAARMMRSRRSWRFRLRSYWVAFRIGLDPRAGAAWSAYIRAATARPDVWSTAAPGQSPSGAPFWLSVQTTLQSDLRYTEAEALAMYMPKAYWLAVESWERGGRLQIATPDEVAVMAAESRN